MVVEQNKKTKKVILFTQHLSIGGLEYMLLNHASELKKNNWTPIVYAYDVDKGEPNLIQEFIKKDILVFSGEKGDGFTIGIIINLLKICFLHKVSIIHSHDIGPLIYGVIAKIFTFGFVKLIHTQHTFIHLEKRKRYKLYEQIFTKFTNRICTVSKQLKDIYIKIGVDENKIEIVPNGIAFPEKAPQSRLERLENRKELLSTMERKVADDLSYPYWLLSLGRISKGKGQEIVLNLWSRLTEEQKKGWCLVLVGPMQDFDFLKNEKFPKKDVFWIGSSKNAFAWHESSDLYISASRFEGLPLAPLEALGSNLPVVLSDIPGHKMLEKQAVYFPLNDLSAAAKILSNEMARVNEWRAFSSIREEFSVEKMTKHYCLIYSKFI